METKGIISESEKDSARRCIDLAKAAGASSVRVSFSKTVNNGINILDGEIDRTNYSEERSIMLHVFADGRFGSFSTNRLEDSCLKDFIKKSVDMTLLLAEDNCRRLPDKGRRAEGCTQGDELGLVDGSYFGTGSLEKTAKVLELCNRKGIRGRGWSLESSEEEYSDSFDDNYIVDSDGFEGRHMETSFAYCAETTVMDIKGNRYSGYWWEASPFFKAFDFSDVGKTAIERATSHIGPESIRSGLHRVVVDRSCASRLAGTLIQALDARNIQQGNSFLAGRDGEELFSPEFTLYDSPLEHGRPGSRMFDSEGVATRKEDFIRNGAVRQFFVNTYMSGKTGMKPTVEDISRPCIRAHICNCSEKEINLDDIFRFVGDGLYVTDFNGGNCNPATGNFSFGVEGILLRNGELVHPAREMLMTGNMIQLWKDLIAAGSDPRKCARWQIPTLAFENVMIVN